MDFYIFRHGWTSESLQHIDYSKERVTAAEILKDKVYVIEKLAEYLKNIPTDYNVSSPFIRCIQTVNIVSGITGKLFAFDDRIGEYTFQTGMTFNRFSRRIKAFVKDISATDFTSVAICTHGGGISALKHYLTRGKYDPEDLRDYPNPGVLTVIKNNRIEEIDFNH